jgi:hypothetical protein
MPSSIVPLLAMGVFEEESLPDDDAAELGLAAKARG